MPIPLRVPTAYLHDTLNQTNRGYTQPVTISLAQLEHLAERGLVRVASLAPLFRNKAAYKAYKDTLSIPNRYWQQAIRDNPTNKAYATRQMRLNGGASPAVSRSSSSRSSGRSRSPSPVRPHRYKKGELGIQSKLGKLTDAEKRSAPRSVMSIQRTGDECDEKDVNWPMPACKVVRKVCRRYGRGRRYMPIKRDFSELKNYEIEVRYQDPEGRWETV